MESWEEDHIYKEASWGGRFTLGGTTMELQEEDVLFHFPTSWDEAVDMQTWDSYVRVFVNVRACPIFHTCSHALVLTLLWSTVSFFNYLTWCGWHEDVRAHICPFDTTRALPNLSAKSHPSLDCYLDPLFHFPATWLDVVHMMLWHGPRSMILGTYLTCGAPCAACWANHSRGKSWAFLRFFFRISVHACV